MATHETGKLLKKMRAKPGTPYGPMGLPISYRKDHYETKANTGAPGVPKSRRADGKDDNGK